MTQLRTAYSPLDHVLYAPRSPSRRHAYRYSTNHHLAVGKPMLVTRSPTGKGNASAQTTSSSLHRLHRPTTRAAAAAELNLHDASSPVDAHHGGEFEAPVGSGGGGGHTRRSLSLSPRNSRGRDGPLKGRGHRGDPPETNSALTASQLNDIPFRAADVEEDIPLGDDPPPLEIGDDDLSPLENANGRGGNNSDDGVNGGGDISDAGGNGGFDSDALHSGNINSEGAADEERTPHDSPRQGSSSRHALRLVVPPADLGTIDTAGDTVHRDLPARLHRGRQSGRRGHSQPSTRDIDGDSDSGYSTSSSISSSSSSSSSRSSRSRCSIGAITGRIADGSAEAADFVALRNLIHAIGDVRSSAAAVPLRKATRAAPSSSARRAALRASRAADAEAAEFRHRYPPITSILGPPTASGAGGPPDDGGDDSSTDSSGSSNGGQSNGGHSDSGRGNGGHGGGGSSNSGQDHDGHGNNNGGGNGGPPGDATDASDDRSSGSHHPKTLPRHGGSGGGGGDGDGGPGGSTSGAAGHDNKGGEAAQLSRAQEQQLMKSLKLYVAAYQTMKTIDGPAAEGLCDALSTFFELHPCSVYVGQRLIHASFSAIEQIRIWACSTRDDPSRFPNVKALIVHLHQHLDPNRRKENVKLFLRSMRLPSTSTSRSTRITSYMWETPAEPTPRLTLRCCGIKSDGTLSSRSSTRKRETQFVPPSGRSSLARTLSRPYRTLTPSIAAQPFAAIAPAAPPPAEPAKSTRSTPARYPPPSSMPSLVYSSKAFSDSRSRNSKHLPWAQAPRPRTAAVRHSAALHPPASAATAKAGQAALTALQPRPPLSDFQFATAVATSSSLWRPIICRQIATRIRTPSCRASSVGSVTLPGLRLCGGCSSTSHTSSRFPTRLEGSSCAPHWPLVRRPHRFPSRARPPQLSDEQLLPTPPPAMRSCASCINISLTTALTRPDGQRSSPISLRTLLHSSRVPRSTNRRMRSVTQTGRSLRYRKDSVRL